jgi:hypothetical protein
MTDELKYDSTLDPISPSFKMGSWVPDDPAFLPVLKVISDTFTGEGLHRLLEVLNKADELDVPNAPVIDKINYALMHFGYPDRITG